MFAIAALCKIKKWNFYYYTKPVALHVKENNFGNLYASKKLGMKHIEIALDEYRNFIMDLRFNLDEKTLVLDQGGADKLAQRGLELLAKEIEDSSLHVKSIAVPSGTGTTALYLALALSPEYTVYTVACIGSSDYLKEQMQSLHKIPDNLVILEASRKYHFAKPYPEFYQMYSKLLDTGVEFDLLYAPLMWKTLLEYDMEEIMYIHSGGVSGNKSMLERYKTKGTCL